MADLQTFSGANLNSTRVVFLDALSIQYLIKQNQKGTANISSVQTEPNT